MAKPTHPREAVESLRDMLQEAHAEMRDWMDQFDQAIEDILKAYPAPPSVMETEARGTTWFTDGFRAIRGSWIGEYRRNDAKPTIGPVLDALEHVVTPVVAVEYAVSEEREVVLTSSDAWADLVWWRELVNGRGLTPCHQPDKPNEAFVYRDAAGTLVAMQMPVIVNEDVLEQRRPALVAPVPEPSSQGGQP